MDSFNVRATLNLMADDVENEGEAIAQVFNQLITMDAQEIADLMIFEIEGK